MRPLCFALAIAASAGEVPRMPMPNNYANSIQTRWLGKSVLASKALDGADRLDTWKLVNTGQATGDMAVTTERKREGTGAIRLRSGTTGDKPIPTTRYYGGASAVRVVNNENWSDWNRLSVWIYPELPGFRVVSLLVIFHNEGQERVPDVYGKMGMNYLILRNREWNHVVWEIANLPRDKVTGIEFAYRLQGNEPGASDKVTFDIDQLELQKVQADHYLGWNVAPGEIAFSHSGYQTGARKSAIASDLDAKQFQVINAATGAEALSKPVKDVKSHIGVFQTMDFSEIRAPGTYILRAGKRSTRPFRIGDDVWNASLWKAINFFYVERCGYAIPGVHDICHRDWMLEHGDKKMVINGGWHDAGDLSQSLNNTAEAAYAMFSLAERMEARGEEPQLLARVIDEAKWGLDWLLKTTFHDGFRPGFSTMDRWTNGVIGDVDDMVSRAVNSPGVNFAAAAAEAIGARVLRSRDPEFAGYALKQAIEDWDFAVAGMSGGARRGSASELAGYAAIASLELYQAAGDRKYAEKALEAGNIILESQQRSILPGLKFPLTGFFYTGPDKTRVLRYSHISREEAPVAALVKLCELFPEHPDWMKWYSSVTLYSEYFQKAMAQFTAPYGMLPNSVFRDDEYLQVPERGGGRGMTREAFREQVLSGVKAGERHYVRLFPVWFEFRGNHGTVLTQAKAISAASHLRGSYELNALAQRQLEWVVGRNPFVQSTMWGEGYDYAPQYSAMSGDIVGSLPVGIQSRGNGDAPYWPAENCHNWKEVWVHPVSRWLGLMRDLAGPALVTGTAAAPVEFRDVATKRAYPVAPVRGRLRAFLPEGSYEVLHAGERRAVTLLPGGSHELNLVSGVEVQVSSRSDSQGQVAIEAVVTGAGPHSLALRADNLAAESLTRSVTLKAGAPQTVVWQAKLVDRDAPWVALVVPDGDLSQRRELTGTAQ